MESRLIISSPPYIKTGETAHCLMFDVLIASLPIISASVFFFGPRALWIILLSITSAIVTEAFIQILFKKPGFKFRPFLYNFLTNEGITILDGSAIITGLLLAFTLPPSVPFWIPIIGAFAAIAIGKQSFGGLGYNIFNPALVGRAFLLAAWPAKITSWNSPINWSDWLGHLNIRPNSWLVDAVTTATPLSLLKLQNQITPIKQLIFGNTAGSLGETSAIAIMLGAIYLLYKGAISWHIPFSYIAASFLLSLLLGENSLFHIFAGGLFLGAFFMATDVVTSPVTKWGRILFGMGAGFLTIIIRVYGAFPEGVCYSILFMNGLTPLIDRYTSPKYKSF